MGRSTKLIAAALGIWMSFPAASRADIITFNAVSSLGNPILTTLTTQGFTFTAGHFHTIDSPLGVSNGSIFIGEEGGSLGLPITMTNGGVFSFGGFDAGGLFNPEVAGFPNATTLSILGNVFGGGTLTASFSLSTTNFASFFLPASWINLTSVVFTGLIPGSSSNAGFALDNIIVNQVVSAAPEPGTLGLIVMALLTVMIASIKQRASRTIA